MFSKRFASLLLSALLAVGLLAGCGSASSKQEEAPASSTASSAASEAVPDSQSEAAVSSLAPGSFDENSLFSLQETKTAFEPCLGWGPGTAGTSLKSVIAAASLLEWAESNHLAQCTATLVENAVGQWYDGLSEFEQECFAEAWPLIRADADTLLTDKSSMSGRIEDAGLDAGTLPGCTQKNWNALKDILDAMVPEALGEY